MTTCRAYMRKCCLLKKSTSPWENNTAPSDKLKWVKTYFENKVHKRLILTPDLKDRHVLAAAIKINANVIVTNNLKDFPDEFLATFGLKAKGVDDFLTDIIDLNQELAVQAFKELVLNRTNPDLDEFQVLDRFRKIGLVDSANYLHSLL